MFILASDISSHTSLPLYKVFTFWLSTINKLFTLLKSIYIMPGVSYFNLIIAFIVIAIFVNIVKFGFRFSNNVRWFDSTVTYWNDENPNGYKNFGNPRGLRNRK